MPNFGCLTDMVSAPRLSEEEESLLPCTVLLKVESSPDGECGGRLLAFRFDPLEPMNSRIVIILNVGFAWTGHFMLNGKGKVALIPGLPGGDASPFCLGTSARSVSAGTAHHAVYRIDCMDVEGNATALVFLAVNSTQLDTPSQLYQTSKHGAVTIQFVGYKNELDGRSFMNVPKRPNPTGFMNIRNTGQRIPWSAFEISHHRHEELRIADPDPAVLTSYREMRLVRSSVYPSGSRENIPASTDLVPTGGMGMVTVFTGMMQQAAAVFTEQLKQQTANLDRRLDAQRVDTDKRFAEEKAERMAFEKAVAEQRAVEAQRAGKDFLETMERIDANRKETAKLLVDTSESQRLATERAIQTQADAAQANSMQMTLINKHMHDQMMADNRRSAEQVAANAAQQLAYNQRAEASAAMQATRIDSQAEMLRCQTALLTTLAKQVIAGQGGGAPQPLAVPVKLENFGEHVKLERKRKALEDPNAPMNRLAAIPAPAANPAPSANVVRRVREVVEEVIVIDD